MFEGSTAGQKARLVAPLRFKVRVSIAVSLVLVAWQGQPPSAVRTYLTLLGLAQNIAVGARILGVISEIGPQELTISLPHGLRGFVDASEVSAAPEQRVKRGHDPQPTDRWTFAAFAGVRCPGQAQQPAPSGTGVPCGAIHSLPHHRSPRRCPAEISPSKLAACLNWLMAVETSALPCKSLCGKCICIPCQRGGRSGACSITCKQPQRAAANGQR